MRSSVWFVKIKYFAIFGIVLSVPGLLIVGGVWGTGVDQIDNAGEAVIEYTSVQDSPQEVTEEFYLAVLTEDHDAAEEYLHPDSEHDRARLEDEYARSWDGGSLNVEETEVVRDDGDVIYTRAKIGPLWRSAELQQNEDGEWRIVEADI